MSVKSIKRVLRDKIAADMQTQMSTELSGVQVVAAMGGDELEALHIRVVSPSAVPQIAGRRNLGRWDITIGIDVVSQIDDTTEDQHDNLVGLVEAYILQGNETLAARLTDSVIAVNNVFPAVSTDMAVEGLRFSHAEIQCECYLI